MPKFCPKRRFKLTEMFQTPRSNHISTKPFKDAKDKISKTLVKKAKDQKRPHSTSRSLSASGALGPHSANGLTPTASAFSAAVDPSMSAKFAFKAENAKPGAMYLEARSLSQIVERDNRESYQDNGFRLVSTQHRFEI